MHYLAVGRTDRSPRDFTVAESRTIADGEMMSLEQPWIFGAPLIVRVDDGTPLDELKTRVPAECNAFAVEGLAEPGDGQAFVFGAHTMRDAGHFRSYAQLVPDVVARFNGRFLVRASEVVTISGHVVPNRVVVIEFPSAHDAVAYYVSDAYAPLLKLRLATANTRLVVLARSGALPEAARRVAEDYLRGRRGAAR
jgi:uncharacterized protein (DUF1330 family)